jgi:hypothetical protein
MHWNWRQRADSLECGGLTPLSYGEARLASEEQRFVLLRVFFSHRPTPLMSAA